MSAQNQTYPQKSMQERIWDIIREIVDKSRYISYIYRGEAKHHCQVSSGLYRAYDEAHKKLDTGCEIEPHDVVGSQCAILQKLKADLPEVDKDDGEELLIQLQHYGCKTNLIDFTTDYAVALFFACYKHSDKDGRVILLENTAENKDYSVIETLRTIHRVEAQKSILVQPKTGFLNIEPCSQVVCVPKDLKKAMLTYLEKHHGISAKRIYKDIHGFIEFADIRPYSLECDKGKMEAQEMNDAANAAEVDKKYEEAIGYYRKALELEPKSARAYIELGRVHVQRGGVFKKDTESEKVYRAAIVDYEKAKSLDDGNAEVYYELGRVYNALQEFPEAISHFTEAIKRDPDNVDFYHERATTYEALADFSLAIDGWNKAIDDWDKVIELRPNEKAYYAYRGRVHAAISEWDKAEQDLEEAKRGRARIVANPQKVADFEKQHGVQLPDKIKALLTQLGILSN